MKLPVQEQSFEPACVSGDDDRLDDLARDRLEAQHDYKVNLKAEMEVMALHVKIDAARDPQWQTLLDLQQQQMHVLATIEERIGALEHGSGRCETAPIALLPVPGRPADQHGGLGAEIDVRPLAPATRFCQHVPAQGAPPCVIEFPV